MSPLSFKGRIDRLPYLFASAAVFFSQHLVVFAACRMLGKNPVTDFTFWVAPLRSLVTQANFSDPILIAGFAYFLLVAWVLAALAFRRAAAADLNEALAAAAMAPIIQIPAILALAVFPSRPPEEPRKSADPRWDYSAAALGLIAGMGVTLAAVAISTLVFGVYGYGLFVVSPLIIGATTGWFANRNGDIGAGTTNGLVLGATALGGIALVLTSLEGLICIVLASPLVAGIAIVGGLLGRSVAFGRKGGRSAVPAFALLPLLFALENLFSVPTHFETMQSVTIAAPADAAWRAILRMDKIEEPLSLPYRLGVAYPIRGEVLGEGVGAVRRGEFSTGTAIERVTEWEENRKLSFVVETDIPAMRELSPYDRVHAPHAVGYFTTRNTRFEILPSGAGVEVTLRTDHEIRLDPILYWMPLARWMVEQNNTRVLTHIRRQAEQVRRAGG